MTQPPVIRYGLGALLALVAVNAFAGGVYGMAGARGVPTEWLDGSWFSTYFVPSVVLFVVVGGTFLFGALAVLANARFARGAAVAAAIVALIWIVAQVAVIGMVSWLQPAIALTAAVVFALSRGIRPSAA